MMTSPNHSKQNNEQRPMRPHGAASFSFSASDPTHTFSAPPSCPISSSLTLVGRTLKLTRHLSLTMMLWMIFSLALMLRPRSLRYEDLVQPLGLLSLDIRPQPLSTPPPNMRTALPSFIKASPPRRLPPLAPPLPLLPQHAQQSYPHSRISPKLRASQHKVSSPIHLQSRSSRICRTRLRVWYMLLGNGRVG